MSTNGKETKFSEIKQYSQEFKQEAVRLVFEIKDISGTVRDLSVCGRC
jgi:transposase-like protein